MNRALRNNGKVPSWNGGDLRLVVSSENVSMNDDSSHGTFNSNASPLHSDHSFGHEEHEYTPMVEQIALFPFVSGSDPKNCLSQSKILCHFGTDNQSETVTNAPEGMLEDVRQQAATRIMHCMNSLKTYSAPAAAGTTRPRYCIGTRCGHVECWRRLRAKKGQIHYVCQLCSCKWRIPTRATLMTLIMRNRQNYNHQIQLQEPRINSLATSSF